MPYLLRRIGGILAHLGQPVDFGLENGRDLLSSRGSGIRLCSFSFCFIDQALFPGFFHELIHQLIYRDSELVASEDL